ncbi:MAG TPA: DUF1631 family protein [Candidatus Binatia bacterium]|nr:DUF1631 family protein [Candidatus Binatia bacterium]
MNATVHPLHPEHAARSAPDSPAGRLLRGLEEMARATIGEQLRVMFESADDLLFEMADKTKNGNEQRLFLDTMRIVRLERPRILKAFQDSLHRAFLRSDMESHASQVNLDDLESWSLQESSELEEKIAISNMDAKAETLYAAQLYELEQRMSHLASRTEDAVSPKALSPGRILEAFQLSMKGLEVEFPIKLVIYKLFDRVVVSNLGRVFSGANHMLAEHGIEPRRPERKPKPAPNAYVPGGTPAGAVAPGGAQMSGSAGTPLSGAFQTMAGDLRSDYLATAMQPWLGTTAPAARGGWMPAGAGTGSPGNTAGGPGAPSPVAAGQMPPGGAPMGYVPPYDNAQLATEMLGVMQAVGRGQPVSSWMPAQNLALVSRMFDDLYSDPRLPEAARPVLGQLQFPAMKVALSDPSFFSNPRHPVRTLVNDVFEAAAGVRSGHGADFSQLEQLIRELLARFDVAPEQLRQARDKAQPVSEPEAEQFLQQQQQRLDAQRKQLKEKVRRIVAQELRLHIGERQLPRSVMPVLLSGFAPLMATHYLRGGAESSGWQSTLALLDDLLHSFDADALRAPGRAEKEAAMVSAVTQRFLHAGLSEEKVNRFTSALLEFYLTLGRDDAAGAARMTPPAESVAAPAEVSAPRGSEREVWPAPAAAHTSAVAATVTATKAASPPAAPVAAAEIDRAVPLLLRAGEWFKVWEATARHCRWLKLSSLHPRVDAIVFEDFGAQNFLKMRMSAFVADLGAGRSAPVDPDPATQQLVKLLPAGNESGDAGAVWYKNNPMAVHQLG